MKFHKVGTLERYDLTVTRADGSESDHTVFRWEFNLDATGLAALIRSVDLATNESKMARSIGLKRKRTTH